MGIVHVVAYIERAPVVDRIAPMLARHSRLLLVTSLLAAVLFGAGPIDAATPDTYDPWPGLVQDIFNNRPMNDGAEVIAIEMPYRAEDAAIVPVTLRVKLPPADGRRVVAITLVVDQNPAPMAARFELGQDSYVSDISTRVRVNSYTDVHAVAELSDGKLYMAKTFVKASGGCSAPAAKNAEEARTRLGQIRFRQFAKPADGPQSGAREAQIMIGHPNNSGLQMDQVTRLYIPAFFIDELRIWQDDTLVLAMQGGISISEDPNIRFSFVPNGAKRVRVEAKDTEGHVFKSEWKIENSGI
jgi:sulfur-oxidizing protein SoxY